MKSKPYFAVMSARAAAAAAIAVLALMAGCAPAVKQSGAPPAAVVAPPAEEVAAAAADVPSAEPEEDPTAPEEPEVDPNAPIDITDIDGVINSARQFCADSMFTAADSALRRVSAFLMKNSVDDETQWLSLQDYIAEIITIYAELMPSAYSIPEEISSMIFKQHLLEALMDTLAISPRDSVFLHRLSNKRGVVYDVPMVWNDRVKRALLFYTRTRHGVFDRWLNRAGYYLPVMRQMFADEGLPQDLAYLPIIESGFNPHAYSRAHAAGIWQFIPSTGRIYGLRQNYWIDERRDPLKSTEAAINYLRKLYGDFGDWHIALASYNCGEGGMSRAIRRAGGVHDYWQLQLPKETMNYIPLYLASVMIAKNPDVFEFSIQDTSVFDLDTVFVNDCIEMAVIAEGVGVELETLKRINPHILHWSTPPDMENVRLYLPNGYADKFREFYADLPDEKKTKFYRYRVQSGDNLVTIARNFRVPVEALREINKMRNNTIAAGQHLIIPVPVNDSIPAALAAHINNAERQRPGQQNRSGGRSAAPRTGRKISYKVRTGETLYSIANRFGVTVNDLMAWNYIASPRHLKAEQTLIIYQPEQSVPPRPAPSAPRVAGASSEHTGQRVVRQGETLYGISRELGVSVNELARINGLDARRPLIFPGDVLAYTPVEGQPASSARPAASSSATPQARTSTASGPVEIYTVKPGDNLWRIALSFGVTVDTIREENNLTANSKLMPGDILRITRGD